MMLAKRRWVFGGLGAALIFSCVGCSSSDDADNGGSTGTTGGSTTGGTDASGGATGNGGTTSGGTTGSGGTTSGGSTGTGATGGTTGSVTTGGLRWVGRVDATDGDAVQFAWQGSGFLATVKGTTLTVKLQVEGSSTVYFQPVIDGTAGERFNVDPGDAVDVTLATGLTDTDHSVELYRETEGAYGVSTFLGFAAGTPSADAPATNGRLIEVVGDSISAGYGNLGSELHPNGVADPACHWTAENSSWYATYAAIAGRALGAEVSTIARSGWGISRDRDGGTNVLPNVYENALGTDDPSPWSFERKPSVVVINLGTNDFNLGDPGAAYETAYVDFIATVRSHYPDAFIFLTIGSML
jgi:lysophospholipase L1-like esterase